MSDDHEHAADAPEQDIVSEIPEQLTEEAGGTEEAGADETGAEEVTASEAVEEEAEEAAEPAGPAPKLERLQKILAQAGIASRRHAEELITGGHVQVNGQTVTQLGSKADAARDHIRVDGKLLRGAERLRYFMLNKPKGYVTTVSDPEGRPTVMEFFTKMGERLYPVGRLDYLSEGLLLVTNDGELANGLTKASSKVDKTYLVKVSGQPDDESLDRLREGVSIDRTTQGEGKVRTAPARIRQVREGENPWFEVVLIEGRNRELRKMFEEIGHHVEKIRRVGYGPLVLDVEPGKLRELDLDEIEALRLTAAGKFKPKRMKTKKMLPKDAGRPVSYDDDRPRSQRVAARPTGTRPPRTKFGKREGGFVKREDRPIRREGGFTRREGGFSKPEAGFAKREGGFEKPSGGFGKRPGAFEKREGGFGKPSGGFAKRPGGFEKREGGFTQPAGKFERIGKPFRPAAGRTERPAGEDRGFAPRGGEEFTPRHGGNARFGRPEGGRTGNRPGGRNDERGRSGASPARPFRSERPSFERPAAPRRQPQAPPENFAPKRPSRLRIDAVDSDQPSTSRPATPRASRPALQKPAFDRPRPSREGQDSFRKGPSGSGRPGTGRSGPARPPRGEGSSRPFTTSTGKPRSGGARPSSKPARPGGRPAGAGFGSKPGSRPATGAGRPMGKPAWKPKPSGTGKPAAGGRSKPRPGGFSKPSGFKPKPGGARRSGPPPGGKKPGGKRNG
jgi:23S rRNA pseudouridine2605 synthase